MFAILADIDHTTMTTAQWDDEVNVGVRGRATDTMSPQVLMRVNDVFAE